jgi:hypothetical protein
VAEGVSDGEESGGEVAGVSEGEHETSSIAGESVPSDSSDSDEEADFQEEIADEDVYYPDTMTPSVQRTYGLRLRKPRDYSHIHAMYIHHAMTQYSVKSGLKKFKVNGEDAISK